MRLRALLFAVLLPAARFAGGRAFAAGADEAPPQGVLLRAESSTEAGVVRPTAFYLAGATNVLFGPFSWGDRSEVKIGSARLQVSGAGDESLSLRDQQSGRMFGPFATTSGAPVALAFTNLTLVRTPSFIRGRLSHEALAVKHVTVVLFPLTPVNRRPLTRLASAFQRLKQQYNIDTATTRYRMPTVRTVTGKVSEPVSEPSDRDIERARKKADIGAKGAFKEFIDTASVRTASCASGERFVFQNLDPGEYVVCALADIRRDPDSRGVPPGAVVWWVGVSLRRYQSTDLKFDAEGSRDWQELFQRM